MILSRICNCEKEKSRGPHVHVPYTDEYNHVVQIVWERRIHEINTDETMNRIMHMLMTIQQLSRPAIYLGICINAACGATYHPHWDEDYWKTLNLRIPAIYSY